ncbi:hypothetical protein PR048_030379 [Dryococelus australis]|uniref:Uncharacterized protein n=1 Tax=Dryococelus australis TaxID=614101 RepID=A0ABQ9G8T8_9NEOP|nr:hypothetical protein PR048_030379 [Dryococelus australis]
MGRNRPWPLFGTQPTIPPGVISENHGKSKSGWPDLESNPGPPECECSEFLLHHLARLLRIAGLVPQRRCQTSVAGYSEPKAYEHARNMTANRGNSWQIHGSSWAVIPQGPVHTHFRQRISLKENLEGSGGAAARALAYHHGDPGSIPGGFAPGFLHVGIVLEDAACRGVFSGYSRFSRLFIPAPLHPRGAISKSVFFPTARFTSQHTIRATKDVAWRGRRENPVVKLHLGIPSPRYCCSSCGLQTRGLSACHCDFATDVTFTTGRENFLPLAVENSGRCV